MFSFLSKPENIECAYPTIKETVPRSSLGYHTNNAYDSFPPIMMDGRSIVASEQPEAVLNNHLLNELGIKSNWEYRKYLTKHAKEIMQYNYMESSNDVGYFKRYTDTPGSYSVPHSYQSYVDNTNPVGHQTSDLKELYLSREQLDARKVAPAITQEEFLKYSRR